MLKHATIYFIASILIILCASFASQIVAYIHYAFIVIGNSLAPLFNFFSMGLMARKIFLLMLIPLTITGIPAIVYQLAKGQTMPYLLETTWVMWLILVLSYLMTTKALL